MITGGVGFATVSATPAEVIPVMLSLNVTVKTPGAARIACPFICVLVPLALITHGDGEHPGPLKTTVELGAPKSDPVNVMVKASPVSGGLGKVKI